MAFNSTKQISVFQYRGLDSDDNFVELFPYDINNHVQVNSDHQNTLNSEEG